MSFDEPEVNPDGFFNDLTSQNACSVRVAVRVRPLIGRELSEGGFKTCVEVDHIQNKLQIGEKNFQFDRVFSTESEQQEIFDVCGRNLVLGCFAGYNATILAYGQTGSGKTHTMGTASTNGLTQEQIGIVPRVFEFIFEELERRKKQNSLSEFTIKISFLELYNEELHDLLDPASIGAVDRITGKSVKELQIKERNGNIYVQGLKEDVVGSKEECLQLLNKGISHRTTSATLMNEGSSRSHAIFTIAIEQKIVREIDVPAAPEDGKENVPGQTEEQITAKFHFVDLAGSERIKRTGATGQLMKEGISINKGLLCLGNVISALTEESKKEKHIPYRDSKLTRILQDSLGGNSRTTMIACVSPAESNYEESLNSIKYASRARNIKNKPVVNRDPNSMLIDSLRQQISGLQGEIKEYQNMLKDNNIPIPDNFSEQVHKKMEENKKPTHRQQTIKNSEEPIMTQGSINFGEIRDIKIKLSKKEKELKELQDQLQQVLAKQSVKDEEISVLQKERDTLRLKNEILTEHLQKNNLDVDLISADGTTMSLIDEYKQKMEKMQKELEKKNQELQSKNNELAKLQVQSIQDEGILRKHMEENQRLKRQIKKLEESQTSQSQGPLNFNAMSPPATTKNNPKFKLNLQQLNGGVNNNSKKEESSSTIKSQHIKRKSQLDNIVIDAEGLNERFINNITNQLESIFQVAQDDELQPLNSARSMKSRSAFDNDNVLRTSSMDDIINNALQDQQNLLEDDKDEIQPIPEKIIEEKEKILGTVKDSMMQMQTELMELMKHEYEKKVQELEQDLSKMDNEKQATLKKATDSKQQQQIEIDYKKKMDDMQKQLQIFKEKEKKQEIVSKQINVQENKIKSLEEDINKMKKTKDQIEKQMKAETEKFSTFKKTIGKELTNAKKLANEKEKEVFKLKSDLKKTDQLAQKKISELKGFQKKIYEDRMRREIDKKEEYDKKGIDIERIKDWINENTDRMLRHQELQEQLQKQQTEKDRIEDEMLQEGEKLSELMLQKERKEVLKAELEIETEPDEGKILEIEEEHYQLVYEMGNITENLDSLDQTLAFVNKKINALTEEVIGLDIDNIEPLKFHGLQSVDAARVTLQTFFSVLLDLNIYKRDLENKCIEQDETILELNEKLRLLQVQVEELIQNQQILMSQVNGIGSQVNLQAHGFVAEANRVQNVTKEKAIKSIVDNLEGFVEYQDLKNLNLTPNEQNSLTKLSLSKIVSNLKQKLKEEETKNQSLSHKLEQAMSDKEQFKLRYENMKNQKKNDLIAKDPRLFKEQQQLDKEEKEKKFSSLANARAQRKGVNPSVSIGATDGSSVDQNRGGDNSTSANTTLSNIKQQNGSGANAHQFKFKSRINPQVKQNTEDNLNQLSQKVQGRNNKNEGAFQSQQSMRLAQAKQKLPMQRKSSSQEKEPIKDRLQNKAQDLKKRSPRKVDSFSQNQDNMNFGSNNSALKKPAIIKNDAALVKNQPKAAVPNFKDRRNQRKMEHTDDMSVKVEPDKVLEIDKIKEETFQITHNSSHMERRQSRARALKKVHERGLSSGHGKGAMHSLFNENGLNVSHLKDFEEHDIEESPRVNRQSIKKTQSYLAQSQDNLQFNSTNLIIDDDSSAAMAEPILSPSKDVRNKWSLEDLAELDFQGVRLIGCDYIDDKIILIFENFTIREIDIKTFEETYPVSLFEFNNLEYTGETVVDFVIDRELNSIAIASHQAVYIFDYSDSYKYLTQINQEGILKVMFCQYNVVVLISYENSQFLVVYQVDNGEEIGNFELQTQGYQAILRTDNQFIYFTFGIAVGKLSVPDLSIIYVTETEHANAILDFNLSTNCIVTTSSDSVRCLDYETGDQIANALDGLECDQIETFQDFIFTRVGFGAAMLVWRHFPMREDLHLIEEIALSVPPEEITDFKMKAKVLAKFGNGVKYNLVIMATCVQEGIIVNALKNKPLSE